MEDMATPGHPVGNPMVTILLLLRAHLMVLGATTGDLDHLDTTAVFNNVRPSGVPHHLAVAMVVVLVAGMGAAALVVMEAAALVVEVMEAAALAVEVMEAATLVVEVMVAAALVMAVMGMAAAVLAAAQPTPSSLLLRKVFSDMCHLLSTLVSGTPSNLCGAPITIL